MKRILLLCCLTAVFAFAGSELRAQGRNVTGKVTAAEDGATLPGVNVVVKGTTNGTVTDTDGKYSINVPADGGILVFSFIGLKTQEVSIGNQAVIDLQMENDVQQLNEVVITGSLGLQKQAKELGYAATTVSTTELTRAKAFDVSQSLNGKVSGVNITTTNSGVFQNSKINIRGIRSLTGNNNPMLVLDGAQVPLSALYAIAPDDIGELTILKSAASAAVYGPDAVNGVFVVTTKRGKSNQNPTVSFTSSYQASRVAYFPKLQHTFGAGAGEVVDAYGNYGYVPFENQIYGPRFDGTIQDIGVHLQDGSIQSGPYAPIHKKDKINFWNTGSIFQNSLSLQGADYFISVNDAQIKGLMPDDQNRRTTIRFNGDKKINKFSIGYGIGYTLQNSNVVDEALLQNLYQGSYSGSIMFAVLQTPDNVPLLNYKDQNNKFAQYSNYYNEFAIPPYWIINNMRAKSKSDNFIGNATLGYDIAPWLKATARISATVNNVRTDEIQNPLQVTEWALANRNSTQYFNAKGSVFNDVTRNSLLNIDYFLNGKKDVGSAFNVTYLVGGNFRQIRDSDVFLGGNNLVVPGLSNVSVRSGDAAVRNYDDPVNFHFNDINNNHFNYTLMTRRASVYGTLGFGFKDWAFLEVTGRNDWDSRLSKANRSFFYPSANLSLVLSDAISSLKESALSYLKVRAAYSKSANVNLPAYSLKPTYAQPTGFPYGSNAGFTANNLVPSTNLKPESVTSLEAGLEIGILNGKVDFEATYFNQQCDNQILQTSLPSSTGYTSGLANAAAFKNKGLEMDLGIAPYKIGKGGLSFKINATYNTNKVTSTPGGAPVVIGGTDQFIQIARSSPTANNIAVVGGPAFQFQLSDYNRDPATGKVIVDPITGNPSQSTTLVVKGRTIPLWIIGFTPRYEIGGFSFAMTWDYKGGHQFYSGLGSDMDFSGISARSASYGRQRFVFPNSVYKNAEGNYIPNTNIQVQDGNYGFWTGSTTNSGIATNYFASAAAFRLREVNISYSLPQKWVSTTKYVKKITISFVARNLFLFVPKSNQWGDPEFNYSSTGNTGGLGSAFQTPASRMYGGSLNFTL